MMGIKIKVNLDGATKKLSDQSKRAGQQAMANQALSDMIPFVPKMPGSGILRSTGRVLYNGNIIRFSGKYARAQFFGTNGIVEFKKYSTPGTGKRWDEKASSLHMEDWKKAYTKGAGL